MLGVALADDVNRASATHYLAVLAHRLHAAADFQLSLGVTDKPPRLMNLAHSFKAIMSSAFTCFIASIGSDAAVTARPITR